MKSRRLLSGILTILLVMSLTAVPVSAQTVPESLHQAAVTLREGIKNWENFITVTFSADRDSFDGTKEAANALAQQVLDLALAHTGVPDEGDYLRFNICHMEPNSVNFSEQDDCRQFTVSYYIAYWTTPEQEAALDAEIESLVTSLDLKSDLTFLRYYPSADPREVFEIPEGVLCIGAGAFADSQNLKEVKMPNTVRRLQTGSFERSPNLKTVNISTSCTFLDQWVFSETALESIHIPASVEQLYGGSFGYKSKLSQISVDPANPYFYVVDNVLYCHYTAEIADTCHMPALGDWIIKYPALSDDTSFTIPEGIVGIEQDAFADCVNLTQIILPDSLKVIYNEAFWNCSNLTKIELPDNLQKIWSGAFAGCSSLPELVIPSNVDSLSYYLFDSYHNLENIVFLGDMPEMSDQTFAYLDLDIYYPAGNTTWEKAIQIYAHESGVRWHEACQTHQFTPISSEATCTKPGYTGQACSVCGLVTVTGTVVSATGHDWVLQYEQQQTCEDSGHTAYECSVCHDWTYENWVDPLGHDYDENGVCTRCVSNESHNIIYSSINVGPDVNTIMMFVLGIPTALIILAFIRKALCKPKKK